MGGARLYRSQTARVNAPVRPLIASGPPIPPPSTGCQPGAGPIPNWAQFVADSGPMSTYCVTDGGTIIPILLASDKTMLSLHHGDQSAWPIYITIGNLDQNTRRKQTVSGSVLLGFLPITSETADESKAQVYHAVMELILKHK